MRVLLVGSGRILYYLARQFSKTRNTVTIVTPHAAEARDLSRRTKCSVLEGDGTEPSVLEEAGAYQADALLALMPNDEDNLVVCQIASRVYRVPRTIALVNDPENEEIFHQLNVSVAISATRILSILLEEQAGFEEISRIVSLAEGTVSVSEVILREDVPAVGSTIEALGLPEEALIGGIIRKGRVLIPKGGTRLEAEDRLILVATEASLDLALRILTAEPPV